MMGVAMSSTINYVQHTGPETATLVDRCLSGDAGAWTLLVERYARLVHAIAVRHGLTPAEVDDVGQEVFLALAQQLHTVTDPARLPGWLATTTRRISWRARQRRTYEHSLDDSPTNDEGSSSPGSRELASPLPTPEELLRTWDRQEALYGALARLGDRCRDLLTMVFLDPEEPSYDDISERLGMPKGSIGPTRNRCLQQLRSLLEGLGVTGVDEE